MVDRASPTAATSTRYNRSVIERMIRVANSFREAERMDRVDIAAMSLEERISAVERLRRERFGEDRAESRLDRVLVSADRPTSQARARGRTRGREALIANKRASARDNDLLDVALLEGSPPAGGGRSVGRKEGVRSNPSRGSDGCSATFYGPTDAHLGRDARASHERRAFFYREQVARHLRDGSWDRQHSLVIHRVTGSELRSDGRWSVACRVLG
jgi:hypothetical protein